MINIRKNVFETNSSSTHSICISRGNAEWGDTVHFTIDEYGWGNDTVYDTASYLYTGILEFNEEIRNDYLDRLKEILDRNNVSYVFDDPVENYGYVDHGYELAELINDLLDNEDLLKNFLFGNSVIYTGNDNDCCDGPKPCDAASESYWEWNEETHTYDEFPNPYHDSDAYVYYEKGN